MRRRSVLATGTTLLANALAGCGHPAVVLDLEPATAEDIADRASAAPDPDSDAHAVVAAASENGSATRRGRRALFGSGDIVRVDGVVYEVSETSIESDEVTVYDAKVDVDPANTTADRGEIRYDDLPAVDRERLSVITESSPPEGEGYDIGVGYGTADEVGNESVFVPEPEYDILVYEGRRYRITIDSETESATTYRYEVTDVAPDVETFADQLRDRYLFELANLSEAERAVVEEATDGAYFEDDEAFRSVVRRLREHDGFEVHSHDGTWLVEYEGTEYTAYAEWQRLEAG